MPFRTQKCTLSEWMGYYLPHTQIMNNDLKPPLDKRIEELADRIADIVAKVRTDKVAEEKAKEEAKRREAKFRKALLLLMLCLSLYRFGYRSL